MFEFKLPDLGEGIHEGEILKWYVESGDTINEDDPLVEIETDKAAVTIPSPRSGKIASRSGDVGDTVSVGEVIVVIDEKGEAEAEKREKKAEAEEEKAKEKKPEKEEEEKGEEGPEEGEPEKEEKPEKKTRESERKKETEKGEKEREKEEEKKKAEEKKEPEKITGALEPEETEKPKKEEKAPDKKAKEKSEGGESEKEKEPEKKKKEPEKKKETEKGGEEPEEGEPEKEQRPEKAKGEGIVPATPATRRLARELGVDLKKVEPSGPGGRVTYDDVKRFAGEAPPKKGAPSKADEGRKAEAEYAARAASAIPFLDIESLPDFSEWGETERVPLRSIRRKVAHKMVTSMVLIPHVTHMDEADVTDLEKLRRKEKERVKERSEGRLTLLAFVVKAVAAGLRAAPGFNASIDPFNEEIVYKKYYNIGIAVDTGKGLVVPVIKEADCKSVMRISEDITRLSGAARENDLEVSDLRGGTFSITNVGPLGGTALVPIINYPESAILGMGKVQQKPVVREGEIVIRSVLPLALSFDHRIADGADAARFVSEMVRHLENPDLLLLET